MAKFYDVEGRIQEVTLTRQIDREAHKAGQTVEAYINAQYPVAANDAPAFDQMVASTGIHLWGDTRTGIQASRLSDIMDGSLPGVSAANVSPGGGSEAPQSRIIFPAAILAAVEDKLARDMSTAANAYDSFVALNETIPGNQFVQIVTNYDGPESNRTGATAQLARPQNMLLLTAFERMGVIPTVSSGVEWADQLGENVTIDFLTLSVARTVANQRDLSAQASTLALLNGDIDVGQGPIPAQFRHKANEFDTSITQNMELTETAWVKWLYNMGDIRTIDWIITDIDTALRIQNREGRPVIVEDDGKSPRIDTRMVISNTLIPSTVKVFVTRHPQWPAGTILGFDSRYAIRRIKSLSADYTATERDVIRRANTIRWDHGSISLRMYEEAFSVLELTV